MLMLREINLLTSNLNNIQMLTVSNETGFNYRNNDFGDEGMLLIGKRLPSLRRLSAAHINISYEGAMSVVRNLPNLTHLDLGSSIIEFRQECGRRRLYLKYWEMANLSAEDWADKGKCIQAVHPKSLLEDPSQVLPRISVGVIVYNYYWHEASRDGRRTVHLLSCRLPGEGCLGFSLSCHRC